MSKADQAKIDELEVQLRRRDERIKELRAELDEAQEMVEQAREHLEDEDALRQQWIEAFDMRTNADGEFEWPFKEWLAARDKLHADYCALVAKWNRFVSVYNATVRPRNVGRPLEASAQQVGTVRKLRKQGASLRGIVAATSLSLRSVRTILDHGTAKERSRTNELRRLEFDKLAAASHRAQKRMIDTLPARIGKTGERASALIKAAKGLGKNSR